MAAVAKLACLLVALMVVAAPATDAAITCGIVEEKLTPCRGFLQGGAGPTPACCGGVRALNDMAKTPQDRQSACRCLQLTLAATVIALIPANAAALPGRCGLSVLVPIDPKSDCSKIH